MLEIRVFDEVIVDEDLDKVIEFIVEKVKTWHRENKSTPLVLTLREVEGRAPPSLEINVNEKVKTSTVFG